MKKKRLTVCLALSVGVAFGLAAGCGDPVHDAEVAALGPEAPNVPPGPDHRPGQPCLTCHGGLGPASLTFVTAGTLYAYPYGMPGNGPVAGGNIHLVDANNTTRDPVTNSAGNFYLTTAQWDPTFPLGAIPEDGGLGQQAAGCTQTPGQTAAFAGQIGVFVGISGQGECAAAMATAIDRGGVYASCAYCHFDPPSDKSPGHIYVSSQPLPAAQ
jgi:hypothetical protein